MQNKFKRNNFLALALVAVPLAVSGLFALARPAMAQNTSLGKRSVKAGSWVDLQVSTSKRQYTAGEPILVTLKATNIQEKDAYLKFSSGQRFDFKVFKIGDKEPAYVWSATRMFNQMTGTVKLKMAQRETYTAEIGSEMGPLKPGSYRLEAHLTNSSQVRALPIEFAIVSKNTAPVATAPVITAPDNKRATLTARTDKRIYHVGEEIRVDFSLQNNPATPTTFKFRSGQTYDVFVKDAAGQPVWNWSANIRFLMVSRPVTLAAGQKQDFSVTWNGEALPDHAITPGKYTVQAVYAADPEIYAAPVTIEIQAADTEANVAEKTQVTTKSGLKIQDLVVGTGAEAVSKQQVTVNYRGTLENGTLFDQSYGRAPFSFLLDGGQVIKGWDEGVQGMKVGGKRRLIILAKLGYGETGAGAAIPPGATLIFEVELLKVG